MDNFQKFIDDLFDWMFIPLVLADLLLGIMWEIPPNFIFLIIACIILMKIEYNQKKMVQLLEKREVKE